jgi:hypothetical protein
MIYLIETTYYDKDSSEILDLLKIGYTNDDGLNKRLAQYKSHNPKFKLLLTIPGATEEMEKKLHVKFKQFHYSDYGKEWFVYNKEIVDYLTNHSTKDSLEFDLRDIELDPSTRIESSFIRSVLDIIYKKKVESDNLPLDTAVEELDKSFLEITETEHISTSRRFWGYIEKKFNITKQDFTNLSITYLANTDEVEKFLERFNKLGRFTDKMRLLCSISAENKNLLTSILESVPIIYKNYYLTLGRDTILKYSCRKCELDAEYSKLKHKQSSSGDLLERIYSTFLVGNLYTKSDIKTNLKLIYTELRISDTPKAIDILKYFNVKDVQITDKSSGKRNHCYEILSRKEDK